MRPTASWLIVCLIGCALVGAGCQSLGIHDQDPQPDGPRMLGADAGKRPPITIPVELAFVRFDEHDAGLREELWTFVDEQSLDAELRRRLNANGLRIGIVTGHLPAHLADRIVPARAAAAGAATEALAEDPAIAQRLLRLLPDRRSEIVAAAELDELVLLEERDGAVQGGTFHDATGLFALRVRPAADGRVQLDLTPEVKHGPMERSWVGEEGMFRMEAGQRQHRREDLHVSLTLPLDAMLVVGCAGDRASTLGDALLRDHSGPKATMRLLAIRPLARAVDPMFGAAEAGGGDDEGAALEIR